MILFRSTAVFICGVRVNVTDCVISRCADPCVVPPAAVSPCADSCVVPPAAVSSCAPSPEPALQVLVRVTVIDLTSFGHSCFSPLKSHCLLNSNPVSFGSLTIVIAISVLLTIYASSSALRSRRAPFSRTFSANPSFPSASTVTTNTLPAASS